MNEAYKADGIITERGGIDVANLPFVEGQRVEFVVWPSTKWGLAGAESQDDISKRLAGLDQLERWIDENLPQGLPILSDYAMDRATIYEGRGL